MDSLLEELKQALESAVKGMSDEQMSWHPADKWCAAEVLEHLYLTYAGTIDLTDTPPTTISQNEIQSWVASELQRLAYEMIRCFVDDCRPLVEPVTGHVRFRMVKYLAG